MILHPPTRLPSIFFYNKVPSINSLPFPGLSIASPVVCNMKRFSHNLIASIGKSDPNGNSE